MCELRFRLRERQSGIGIIQYNDRLARCNELSVVRADRDDHARYLSGDLYDITTHVSIVRHLVITRIRVPVDRCGQHGGCYYHSEDDEGAHAPACLRWRYAHDPNTCFAMIFRWISLLPPKIDQHR